MDTLLELRSLYKSFDGIKAVNDFSLNLRSGSIVSLIGPNGAGKTTVFNLVSGLIRPDSGDIYFKGRRITRLPAHKIAQMGISRTFQDLRLFYRMTVLENVMLAMRRQNGEWNFFASIRGTCLRKEEKQNLEKAKRWLETAGLAERTDYLAGDLSYGQQKLLCIARCLAAEPDIMLLDEPVSGLSSNLMDQMLYLIKKLSKQGVSIWLIEHHIEAAASISDQIVAMNDGKKMVEGPPHLIRTDKRILEAYIA